MHRLLPMLTGRVHSPVRGSSMCREKPSPLSGQQQQQQQQQWGPHQQQENEVLDGGKGRSGSGSGS